MANAELAQEQTTARDINMRLASGVMGWTHWADLSKDCPCEPGVTYFADWGNGYGLDVYLPEDEGDPSFGFNPAKSVVDALTVAEKLKADDFWPSMVYKDGPLVVEGVLQSAWLARFRCVRGGTRGDHYAADESLPLAICKAALEVINRA